MFKISLTGLGKTSIDLSAAVSFIDSPLTFFPFIERSSIQIRVRPSAVNVGVSIICVLSASPIKYLKFCHSPVILAEVILSNMILTPPPTFFSTKRFSTPSGWSTASQKESVSDLIYFALVRYPILSGWPRINFSAAKPVNVPWFPPPGTTVLVV